MAPVHFGVAYSDFFADSWRPAVRTSHFVYNEASIPCWDLSFELAFF